MKKTYPLLTLESGTSLNDLSWLPTAEALSKVVRDNMNDVPPQEWLKYLQESGVEPDELSTSLYSTHIAVQGLSRGAHFTHHEVRGHIPLPQALAPSQKIWEEEGTVPVWRDGVLHAPKYFSFALESPLPPFHPNHRKKWRAHELLHTSVGFFWRPQLTRFEAYVGARLSELLPIVHWYGLDEMGRNRCPKHIGQLLYREYCSECEALAGPFWNYPPPSEAQDKALLKHAAHAIEHFKSEFLAILTEIETGELTSTPRPNLDASSDAQGYLLGHWNRITAWSFGSWVSQFCIDGVDYHSSLTHFAQHVSDLFRSILMGEQEIDPEKSKCLQMRQSVLDISYRAYCVLEWFPEDLEDDTIMGCLEDLSLASKGLLDGSITRDEAELAIQMLDATMAGFKTAIPDGVLDAYLAHGHVVQSKEETCDRGFQFILDGLASGLPDMLNHIDGWESHVRTFLHSSYFLKSGALRDRFVMWLLNSDAFPDEIKAAIQIEAWLRGGPHKDERAELFACMPTNKDWGKGELRSNTTLRRHSFPANGINIIFGWELEEGLLNLCCIWTEGAPQVFLETQKMTAIFEAVTLKEKPEQTEEVMDLLNIGALVWLPAPQ